MAALWMAFATDHPVETQRVQEALERVHAAEHADSGAGPRPHADEREDRAAIADTIVNDQLRPEHVGQLRMRYQRTNTKPSST